LQRQAVAVAAGNVHHSADSLLARKRDRRQRRHPSLAGMVIGQRDDVDSVSQRRDPLAHPQRVRHRGKRDLRRRQRSQRHTPER
jgi:hypothetical protein